jgi:hypothetical protein
MLFWNDEIELILAGLQEPLWAWREVPQEETLSHEVAAASVQ